MPASAICRSPRFSQAAWIVRAFVVARILLFAFIYLVRDTIPARVNNWNKGLIAFPNSRFWDSFVGWDSGWYNRVALHGYYFEGSQSDVAFFPAFPYLSRWVGYLVGGHVIGGLVISNLALLGGLFFVYGIAGRYGTRRFQERAVIYALIYPTSIFLSAYYTEGLFFFAAAGALYFYETEQLILAGLFGCLAALTRSTGVMLFPALAIGLLHRRHYAFFQLGPRFYARACALLLIPCGLLCVMWMQKVQVGDPFAFINIQRNWGRSAADPSALVTTLYNTAHRLWLPNTSSFLAVELGATLVLFLAAAVSMYRLDFAHTIFILCVAALPLSTGVIESMSRYALSAVPIYLIFAFAGRSRSVDRALTVGFVLLLALHTSLFVSGYWAG